jgi:hypothetical protein
MAITRPPDHEYPEEYPRFGSYWPNACDQQPLGDKELIRALLDALLVCEGGVVLACALSHGKCGDSALKRLNEAVAAAAQAGYC